jgi:hypothetical protein
LFKVQLRFGILIVELSGTSPTSDRALELVVNNTGSSISIRQWLSIFLSTPIVPLTLSQLCNDGSSWTHDRRRPPRHRNGSAQ